ncbi:DNA replication/repair protein RecF [Desulfosporosinus meridiei]|uniref:DNA replication and repair protein RecF n=1 Tax=Desulfosporosinus meridiei (strain ATCC BAA-275 / DSM 13257 / KCTC 12902 / NCIMB 13706 / S10) TaxID=768704 RepID=J7IPM3_DESMD|nr:DNA replication/repair protein RecF [Desulfosporosinus meridiei]AFQ42114.1 DNA replication and repair protein RecF [Desulfosporosinus meridiei DSM 13257]
MMINSIRLQNFRNYVDEIIHFMPGTNILIGDNGQGKTNIIEGIYYLLTGKSYRVHREQELLRWEQSDFHIYGQFLMNRHKVSLESHYKDKKKMVKINQVACQRLSDFVGTINVIFFSPDDLVMIKGGPAERRRFLDLHIAQMRPGHVSILNAYNKALQQKNALLKSYNDKSFKYSQLQLWNQQIIELGKKIILNRADLTERLQGAVEPIFRNLSSEKETIKIMYYALGKSSVSEAISEFANLLNEKLDQEIERQMILIGPHRDDLQIFLNDKPGRLYASQGQQRSLVLSLKLAELELMRQEKGEYPLLLLDDVLSELDRFRRDYLIKFIESSKIQTLITMTSADNHLDLGTVYFVEKGHIRREA